MSFRKNLPVLLVLSALLPLAIGCGGKHLDRQGLEATARISVVSVVIPRVADISRGHNRAVLQASVDRALDNVIAGLSGLHGWKVIDPGKDKKGRTVQAFGKVSDADLVALFPAAGERNRVVADLGQALSQWKDSFLGAEGLPVIPRKAFLTDDEGPQPEGTVQKVMLQEAGRLCGALNVDAVAFVHLRASLSHPREGAFIVSDNRTDGMLRMAATLVIVDKAGRIIVDRGWPRLDETAAAKDLLPLYKGAGKNFVKEENIDLGDARKKVQQAFNTLTDEAVAALIADLKAALAK
ncbi:MAG: hypothetical protein ACYC7L_03650 [Nitrospirota bacterium]